MCSVWKSCCYWLKFYARDFSLDNAPQESRPAEVDSDQIETLIENNQCYTMQEIANILKISKSIVIGENEKCVRWLLVKMKASHPHTIIEKITSRLHSKQHSEPSENRAVWKSNNQGFKEATFIQKSRRGRDMERQEEVQSWGSGMERWWDWQSHIHV